MTVLELKGLIDNLVDNNRGDYSINILADKSTICTQEGWTESSTFKKLQIEDVGTYATEVVEVPCPCCDAPLTEYYPITDNEGKHITEDGYVVLHFTS